VTVVDEQQTKRQFERKDYFRQISGRFQDTEFYGTVQNLSEGGVCFETDFLIRTGQALDLTLETTETDPKSVHLRAEVVWVQPIHMLFHRIGAKFTGLDSEASTDIAHFISGFEKTTIGPLSAEEKYPLLFSPFSLSNLTLKNHLTMAPMFWGYAKEDGSVSRRLVDTYREIALGGVGMIVVANAVVDPSGLMAPRAIHIHEDRFVPGLTKLAEAIKDAGSVACLQINHGGRWANVEKPLAPSPLSVGDSPDLDALEGIRKGMSKKHQLRLVNKFLSSLMKCRKAMTQEAIEQVQEAFAMAALRAKEAGFDMVELHGSTGYLLAQFLSPRSNRRSDKYGGTLENRMRFPLEVLTKVKKTVGEAFPVGYRLLADEWLPGGFDVKEARVFAQALEKSGITYLSVTAGTYESFFLPEIMNRSRKEGYATDLAKKVKEGAPKTPVVVAGRIVGPIVAEKILRDGDGDLIGLARTLFADPQWPNKVKNDQEDSLLFCKCCNTCLFRVINDDPAVCARWDKVKRTELNLGLVDKKAKWEKILIAMDDSEKSLGAVEYVGHMIGQGKQITLFSIVHEDSEENTAQQERQALLFQAKGLLRNTGIHHKDIAIKVAVVKKGIEQDLLEELVSGEYGSVILGKRGVSRARQVLFGSISNYIVHHAKGCGVWVVD